MAMSTGSVSLSFQRARASPRCWVSRASRSDSCVRKSPVLLRMPLFSISTMKGPSSRLRSVLSDASCTCPSFQRREVACEISARSVVRTPSCATQQSMALARQSS
ncbi:hypothetical protein GWR55_13735 [Edaphobacter sp. 12200R-103]|nr:hypothetical protein GWR55_13735 [Edaphobacter sp. 12200R-103]